MHFSEVPLDFFSSFLRSSITRQIAVLALTAGAASAFAPTGPLSLRGVRSTQQSCASSLKMASVSVQGGPENIPCERGDTVREVMLAGKAELYYTMKGATAASGAASVPLAAIHPACMCVHVCACVCMCVSVCSVWRGKPFCRLTLTPAMCFKLSVLHFLAGTQILPHHIPCSPAFVDSE